MPGAHTRDALEAQTNAQCQEASFISGRDSKSRGPERGSANRGMSTEIRRLTGSFNHNSRNAHWHPSKTGKKLKTDSQLPCQNSRIDVLFRYVLFRYVPLSEICAQVTLILEMTSPNNVGECLN
jgi:hypothetical protein